MFSIVREEINISYMKNVPLEYEKCIVDIEIYIF